MQSIFSHNFGINRTDRARRDRKPRRLQPSVDGLERRALLSAGGGSVTLAGGAVTVAPAATGANTVTVSYQTVGGVAKLDVNLNNTDNYFAVSSVTMVYFNGTGLSGNETFVNNTHVLTVAYGGSGANDFTGGSGTDEFIGGSGTNVFHAGSGFDIMAGGSGTNVFDESATTSGIIFKGGSSSTINDPGSAGHYYVY